MASENDYRPKLRNVEPVRLVLEGREVIGLKDPLQLSDQMLCLRKEALHVLALLDGSHSVRDIQAELSRRAGRLIFSDEIKAIVDTLDRACLLDGERFRTAFDRKVTQYRQQGRRPASHAGTSYNAAADALSKELDEFFTGSVGPGAPSFFSDSRRAVGLIAPHIDIRSGGRCFAHAYCALAESQPSDIYVIFGTGHAGVEGIFTATNLDFETPLGVVETDREFVKALSGEFGQDAAAEEILHSGEHVIEFQLIFLQHVLSGRHSFTIVPILCSLSHQFFQDNSESGSRLEIFERFCAALKSVCRASSRSICFIASADLDHIGPRYGDSFIPHRGTVQQALEKDLELIGRLERVDLRGFIEGVAADNDARRVCGFSPIASMLNCMDASEGRLLALDYAHVDDRNSFVTFTSMIFH